MAPGGHGSVEQYETLKAFYGLFRDHGSPRLIRNDNGAPFATQAICGLPAWLRKLGITPDGIEPDKP